MADTTHIARIPTFADVSQGPSLRPSGATSAPDFSGLAQGIESFGAGVGDLGAGLDQREKIDQNRKNVADVSAADAAWLKGKLDLGNRYQKDSDYGTFDDRVQKDSTKLQGEAASLISDPTVRQKWMEANETERLTLADAVHDHGVDLSNQAAVVKLDTTLTNLSKVVTDPETPTVSRDQARKQMDAAIKFASSSGLLGPGDAETYRLKFADAAEKQLALNRAELGIVLDPSTTYRQLGIPSNTSDGSIASAVSAANGGAFPPIEYSLGKMTADLLGDANFPADPKLAAAYLADPTKAAQYQTAAVAALTDRYKGDLSAVVIALDPKGGTAVADRYVASNHSAYVLPTGVKTSLDKTMAAYRPEQAAQRIPITSEPGIDISTIDPNVIDRAEQVQSAFGQVLPVVPPSAASDHLDRRSIDMDISGVKASDRARLVQVASAMGFTGIKLDENTLHLDTGARSFSAAPVKSWAGTPWAKQATTDINDAGDAHLAGKSDGVPMITQGVAPQFAPLDFDQRLALADKAKNAMNQKNVGMRASIETVADNAPAAIANTGTYSGPMPTATDFVTAYGADDGIVKYRAFQTQVDTAKATYGFRTASASEITAAVEAATPTSTSDNAANEQHKFQVLSAAAQTVLKAREDDPAGYVLSEFPDVAAAWQKAGTDPQAYTAALTAMQAAQTKLGVDKPQLLPKQVANDAANTFKDSSRTASERIGAITSLMLRTSDQPQQLAIYNQLVTAGVPAYTQGAIAALVRGDSGAAQRLMTAVLVDPSKLTGKFTDDATIAKINDELQSSVFGPGQIGDVIYGITDGSAESITRLNADASLMVRAVQMHMIDGSAGGDIGKAVELVTRDMYGDVSVVTAPGVKITLPTSDDPNMMISGFGALKSHVGDALRTDLMSGGLGAFDPSTNQRAIVQAGIDNYVQTVMGEGYFINAGDDVYQFFNPMTGAVIPGNDGKPMTFGKADVQAAGQAVPAFNPNNAALHK